MWIFSRSGSEHTDNTDTAVPHKQQPCQQTGRVLDPDELLIPDPNPKPQNHEDGADGDTQTLGDQIDRVQLIFGIFVGHDGGTSRHNMGTRRNEREEEGKKRAQEDRKGSPRASVE